MNTEKFFNTAFNIGYYGFLILVIFLAVFIAASAIPMPGNYKIKIVKSGSMEPAIHTGSVVVIRPGTHPYAVGDTITFGKDTRKDIPTTHRIIEVKTQEGDYLYKVKGDANDNPDPKEVRQSEVIGKVLFSVPYLGFILDMAKRPVGFVLLVVLPATIIIIDEVKNIWMEIKKRKTPPVAPPTQIV